MKSIINTVSGRYPMLPHEVVAEVGGITMPSFQYMPDGYAWVEPTDPPEYDWTTHYLREVMPIPDAEGTLHQAWEVSPLSPEAINDLLIVEQGRKTWEATEKRKQVEEGGIALSNGVRVATTKDDQNRITTVIANAHLAGVQTVDFKAESGWVSLTMEQIGQIAAAIALHVQACFSAERAHHLAIANLETLDQIRSYDLNAGWPGAQG